mmetsp:Transcript_30360/g.47353  ORF Transcript_30360/g.47353 Transcript_30360/m.47353 type:complete len:81 (-) Transcript_30360:175-417(-)
MRGFSHWLAHEVKEMKDAMLDFEDSLKRSTITCTYHSAYQKARNKQRTSLKSKATEHSCVIAVQTFMRRSVLTQNLFGSC